MSLLPHRTCSTTGTSRKGPGPASSPSPPTPPDWRRTWPGNKQVFMKVHLKHRFPSIFMAIYCQRQHSIISLLLHHFYTTLIDVKRLYKVKSYGVLIIPLSLTHWECIMANQTNIHNDSFDKHLYGASAKCTVIVLSSPCTCSWRRHTDCWRLVSWYQARSASPRGAPAIPANGFMK